MVCLVLAMPAFAATVVPDAGVALTGSTADIQHEIDMAQAAGVRWVSIGVSWASLEPVHEAGATLVEEDSPAWAELGARLGYASSRGMHVEIRFYDAPAWASGRDGVTNDPPTPTSIGAYGDFLAAVARRFGSELDAYSPWNEPNLARFWNPVSPEAYTALQKVAYPAIKAVDPTAFVLSAPIVGTYPTAYDYLARAYAAGLRGSADVIGWNGYPHGAPEDPDTGADGVPAGNTLPGQLYLRTLIDRFDPGRRVWIMEMSWSTCVPCVGVPDNGATEAQQADYLIRAYTYRRRYLTGITDKIFWYAFRDAGDDPHVWEDRQGLVRTDFSPKPAYAALRSLGVPEIEPGLDTPPSPVSAGTPTLPPAAARPRLPARVRAGRRLVALGRPALVARRGVLHLTLRVRVAGGTSLVRVEGYRAPRWRLVTIIRVRRSGRLTVRFRDRGFAGVRVRATAPGRRGWRAARVVPTPRARR
jgi:hypothetical protein